MFERLNLTKVAQMASEPWAQAMRNCEHDSPEHHAEGGVWTHTVLVLNELWNQKEYYHLSEDDQMVVSWGALLHDVAKPMTVEQKDGQTHFPKHTIKGARLARQILTDRGFYWKTRERICNLIRYHGQPPFIIQSQNPENWTIDLSWRVETNLLYLLCMADAAGRRAKNMAEYPEWIQLWKMMAEECNCFNQPYPFVNNQARFLFFRDLLSSLHYTPYEDYACQMTMMSGLPGVGKDTWIARNMRNVPVVSLDDLREEMGVDPTDDQGGIMQEAKQRVKKHFAHHENFIFNATNLVETSRNRWMGIAYDYKASVKIVYLEPPLKNIFEQNKQRDRVVPEHVILNMWEHLEVPTLTECHELVCE